VVVVVVVVVVTTVVDVVAVVPSAVVVVSVDGDVVHAARSTANAVDRTMDIVDPPSGRLM
jgi:hypothetical protein